MPFTCETVENMFKTFKSTKIYDWLQNVTRDDPDQLASPQTNFLVLWSPKYMINLKCMGTRSTLKANNLLLQEQILFCKR